MTSGLGFWGFWFSDRKVTARCEDITKASLGAVVTIPKTRTVSSDPTDGIAVVYAALEIISRGSERDDWDTETIIVEVAEDKVDLVEGSFGDLVHRRGNWTRENGEIGSGEGVRKVDEGRRIFASGKVRRIHVENAAGKLPKIVHGKTCQDCTWKNMSERIWLYFPIFYGYIFYFGVL